MKAYPHRWNQQPFTLQGVAAGVISVAAKSDYAVNVGDSEMCEFDSSWLGPESLREGDLAGFVWPSTEEFTGVIFARSEIRDVDIRDGLSKTYLLAEKYVDAEHYETGDDWGDNENLYSGFNNDNGRSTKGAPQPDQPNVDHRNQFGSAHPTVWQAAMCDGSVQSLGFDIDPAVHRQRGNRSDRSSTSSNDDRAGQRRFSSELVSRNQE